MPFCLYGHPMVPGRVLCDTCGRYEFNATNDKGFTGTTIKASDMADALDVDATNVTHITTGPWDPPFGQTHAGTGPVRGMTYLVCGLAGSGKSTVLLQIGTAIARVTGKPAYYISGEQAGAELRFTLNRLGVDLSRGQLRLAKSMGSSGLIDDSVLRECPPSCVIVDSVSELCGPKNYDQQVALAKAYKEPVASRYQCPVFLISHMNKGGDTLGMSSLQHGPDALIEVQLIDDGRRRARILREYGLEDGDVRMIMAFKNRYAPSHVEHPLLMTEQGFTAIPKSMEITRSKTGDPIRDLALAIQWLDEDIANQKATIREMREEREELQEKLWKLAAKPPKAPKAPKVEPKTAEKKTKPRAKPKPS